MQTLVVVLVRSSEASPEDGLGLLLRLALARATDMARFSGHNSKKLHTIEIGPKTTHAPDFHTRGRVKSLLLLGTACDEGRVASSARDQVVLARQDASGYLGAFKQARFDLMQLLCCALGRRERPMGRAAESPQASVCSGRTP